MTMMMMTRMMMLRMGRTVLPALATMLPMQRDKMNCARKTMQETMAMSVPMPRTYREEEGEDESCSKPIVECADGTNLVSSLTKSGLF